MMMALNDIYRISAAQTLAGKELINTFYYRENGVTAGGPQIVAGALTLEFWSAIWLNWWQPLVSFKLDLTSIFARRAWPTVTGSVVSLFTGESGAIGNDAIPNGSAVLLSGRPELPLTNFNRRMYFAGLPEIHQSNSAISGPQRGNWNALATRIRSKFLAPPSLFPVTFEPVAFSQVLADLGSLQPWAPIFSAFANDPIRSQRQRNVRRVTS